MEEHGTQNYGENLTFSFLLRPNCNIKKLETLTILIAKVIVKVIKELYDIDLEIKYPNDVIISGKKLGGILTESTSRGETSETVLIRNRFEYKSGRIWGRDKEKSNFSKKRIWKRIFKRRHFSKIFRRIRRRIFKINMNF